MTQLKEGDDVVVYLKDTNEPPYRIIGTFKGTSYTSGAADWEYIVEGGVGDLIGRLVFIPRENVKLITKQAR